MLVSIIVPVYNDAKGLSQCLFGLKAVAFSDTEIIVVDDGSTDSTASVVEGADVRVKSAGNENQSSRSNDGTAQAQGTRGDGGMAWGEILEGA